jgi:hypothetical protein
MWRSDRMIFTAILDKGREVGASVPSSRAPLRDRRSTPGWPLPRPAKTAAAPAPRFEPADRELQQLHRVLLEVGVQRARMSTNGYGGVQSGADGRKVAGDA